MKKETIFKKYETLKKSLKQNLFGQDQAIEDIINALLHIELSGTSQNFKAFFTFIGPHNSGKVYLAKLLAKNLPGYDNLKIFDMAEYTDPNDQKKLFGPHGSLEGFVKKFPKAIVVFKDIDKADNIIQLAILNFIKTAPQLQETIFIFTTTAGSNLLKKEDFLRFYKKDPLQAQAKIIEYIAKETKLIYDIVESAIAPELLSAMAQNYIILFSHLSFEAIIKIASRTLQKSIRQLQEQLAISIEIHDKKLPAFLTLSFAPYINARRVSKKIPDLLIDIIYKIFEKFPDIQKLAFDVAPEAKEFLQKVDKNFLQTLIKKNETISLEWDFSLKNSTAIATLKKVHIKKLPHYISPTEKPKIGYSTISFKDIAGQKSVKDSLKEIIKIVKNPDLVKEFGINLPKGMLLYGPKGVGKTLLAYAFAKEANMPYVLLQGLDIFDQNLIHIAYEKAKEFSPAIVFLDEIDIQSDLLPTYETLIHEIDAVQNDEYVFTIVTATNKDSIDKNLLASERIDILIEVPELDMEARKFFIQKILQMPNDGKIDPNKVARYMSGLSGYEMQRIAKEAALYVIRKNLKVITEEILIEQINNVKYGQKIDKKRIRNLEKDLKKTAYHEAGHAVLSYLLLPDIKIEQVTVTPRAETLGFVSYSDEFISNVSKQELFYDICVALAGRIAKMKKFPEEGEDTGAMQDLEQATWEAYNLVATFGMDEEIGYIHIDTLNQNVSKELFKKKVEERIAYWIEKATKETKQLVDKHWDKIEKVAQALIQKEMIDGEELKKIMES
ncbi:AAA family ATPase [Nitratiruptor tergarcus]|uniref:ATP-dependent Zn proteases n=1 Tax=Nitratiruptor tergarcus DSM 16512 TaxID=1069081 RepID=A0A1W1WUI7_9BACT|nr:AAA family ATPase [Nitratiruptor tergarcus]SMC09849.1 ATP-dependent Zn proteases [Nitratiruptor tergarcus DSM 16512]